MLGRQERFTMKTFLMIGKAKTCAIIQENQHEILVTQENTRTILPAGMPTNEIKALLETTPYRGTVKLKQLGYLKNTYKGKNDNGGRSCKMVTPSSYKNRPNPLCITWGSMPENAPRWSPESPTFNTCSCDMDTLESVVSMLDTLVI